MQTLPKFHPAFDPVLARILQRVPGAVLVIVYDQIKTGWKEKLRSRLERCVDRVGFIDFRIMRRLESSIERMQTHHTQLRPDSLLVCLQERGQRVPAGLPPVLGPSRLRVALASERCAAGPVPVRRRRYDPGSA
jgi:hypothetical protein